MPACDYCGSFILLGGKRQGNWRFCNGICAGKAASLLEADGLPRDAVDRQVQALHQGTCPRCQGPGPVDVYYAHRVWSALAFTRWSSRQVIACRSCGRKAQLGASAFSLALGWWGFPWGLLMTPVQLARNAAAVFRSPDPTTPSPALERVVRMAMASAQEAPAGPTRGPGPASS